MTEIHLPDKNIVEGIFLLSYDDLKELDTVLKKVKRELSKEGLRQLTKVVDKEIEDYRKRLLAELEEKSKKIE